MTLDLDAIAREAGYKHPDAVGSCEDFEYFDLKRFAALLLEKAAEELYLMPLAAPKTVEESAYLMASIDAGNILRAMAAGMGE